MGGIVVEAGLRWSAWVEHRRGAPPEVVAQEWAALKDRVDGTLRPAPVEGSAQGPQPPTGRPAFSRYACVQGPGVEACWHKMPARHRGTDLSSEYATLLLLPWPLEVNASDFRPVEGSVQRPKDPFGFFEFAPREGLDLDLLDRVLVAARREAGSVDVVCLPESAVEEGEIG